MKRPRLILLLLTALGCVLGLGLRMYVFTHCLDAAGRLIPGSRALYGILAFLLAGTGVMLALCLRLNRNKGRDDDFSQAPWYLFGGLMAALALFFGNLIRLLDRGAGDRVELVLCLAGMAGAGLLALTALFRGRGYKWLFWAQLLPALYAGMRLIMDFRLWSLDPIVIDFVARLFAGVSAMIGMAHQTGFALGYGSRRTTVFWGLCGWVYAVLCLPDCLVSHSIGLGELAITLGLGFWMFLTALHLLRPEVQSEPAPVEEAPETPNP